MTYEFHLESLNMAGGVLHYVTVSFVDKMGSLSIMTYTSHLRPGFSALDLAAWAFGIQHRPKDGGFGD